MSLRGFLGVECYNYKFLMNFVNGMGYTMPYPQVYGSLPQYYCQASGFLYPVGVPMVVYQPGMIEQQIAGSTIPVKKSDKYGEG